MLFNPEWLPAKPVEIGVKLLPYQKTLIRAADYIEAYGWCQHEPHDMRGGSCALGALNRVGCHIHSFSPEIIAFRRIVNSDSVVHWNDAVGRTKEEVVSALRKAATVVL